MATTALHTQAVENAPVLNKSIVILMAFAAGLSVASIYYNQPMLGILAREFPGSAVAVAMIPVMTQVGYAAGLLLLSPLGDSFERRGLIVWTTIALAVSLAGAAFSPSMAALAAISLAVGALATVAQQIVPMAAHLAPNHEKGKVVGLVMSGLLTGILLSRTVSGFISEFGSWRLMFGFASVSTLVLAVGLALWLPRVTPIAAMTYHQLLRSLAQLFAQHSTLRRSGLVQALLFAGFVSFWTTLAFFLEQPPFHLGSSVVGTLGIVGVVGVMTAPLVGKLVDKGGHGRIIALGSAAVGISFALFWFGRQSMAALVIGIILMDAGLQAAMISNQARVYALDGSARSRLNTVYMTIMFVGGAIGSAVGAQAFAALGWLGVCAFGVACGVLALLIEALSPA